MRSIFIEIEKKLKLNIPCNTARWARDHPKQRLLKK